MGNKKNSKKRKRAIKTIAQQRYVRPRKAPIEVDKQLKTTVLCSIRAFGEVGVSKLILGYYKGLLADEVCTRARQLATKYCQTFTLAPGQTAEVLKELFDYADYYSDDPVILRACGAALGVVASRHVSIRKKVVGGVMSWINVRAQGNADNIQGGLRKVYLGMLVNALDLSSSGWNSNVDSDWKNTMVDQFLNDGLGQGLLQHAFANDLAGPDNIASLLRFVWLNLFCRHGADLRRRDWLQHFSVALARAQTVAAADDDDN